jgi:pimeloyl-ACP methyl ester carboxylesterase
LASAGVIAAGLAALGVELAVALGFGAGALQAARLAKSIPVSAKVEAILLIFIFTPVSMAYAESNSSKAWLSASLRQFRPVNHHEVKLPTSESGPQLAECRRVGDVGSRSGDFGVHLNREN